MESLELVISLSSGLPTYVTTLIVVQAIVVIICSLFVIYETINNKIQKKKNDRKLDDNAEPDALRKEFETLKTQNNVLEELSRSINGSKNNDSDDDSEEKEEEEVIAVTVDEATSNVTKIIAYRKNSFEAKMRRSDSMIKGFYNQLYNYLSSYKCVKRNLSFYTDYFKCGSKALAKFAVRGKTLVVFTPLDPKDFAESKIHVVDMSQTKKYADVPCMFKIKTETALKNAKELLSKVIEKENLEIDNLYTEKDITKDFKMRSVKALIGDGLIKENYYEKVFDQSNKQLSSRRLSEEEVAKYQNKSEDKEPVESK